MEENDLRLFAELNLIVGDNESAKQALAEIETRFIELTKKKQKMSRDAKIHYIIMTVHILYEILKHTKM